MAVNKVIYGGNILIDLTGDTVTADKILKDFTAHGKDGEHIVGICPFEVDSTDATVTVAEMLIGKTGYARGTKLTGTMPNKGAVVAAITTKAQAFTIPHGYHDGSSKVAIDTTEQAKIIASNIRQGVEVLGITGTLEPSSEVTAQAKSVTPATTQQTVLPDASFDYLSQVTVAAIPYVESANPAGGTTVTIVVYNQKTLIDLTGDTVIAAALKKGYTAHKADGTVIVGTFEEAVVLSGKTAPGSAIGKNGDIYVKLI